MSRSMRIQFFSGLYGRCQHPPDFPNPPRPPLHQDQPLQVGQVSSGGPEVQSKRLPRTGRWGFRRGSPRGAMADPGQSPGRWLRDAPRAPRRGGTRYRQAGGQGAAGRSGRKRSHPPPPPGSSAPSRALGTVPKAHVQPKTPDPLVAEETGRGFKRKGGRSTRQGTVWEAKQKANRATRIVPQFRAVSRPRPLTAKLAGARNVFEERREGEIYTFMDVPLFKSCS